MCLLLYQRNLHSQFMSATKHLKNITVSLNFRLQSPKMPTLNFMLALYVCIMFLLCTKGQRTLRINNSLFCFVCLSQTGFNTSGKPFFVRHHTEFKNHNIFSVKLCSLHATNFSTKKASQLLFQYSQNILAIKFFI